MSLLKVKDVMTKNPIKIEKNTLATKALSIMNEKKITSLCVYNQNKKSTTIGLDDFKTSVSKFSSVIFNVAIWFIYKFNFLIQY
jgi:predicted transcriptional regulator